MTSVLKKGKDLDIQKWERFYRTGSSKINVSEMCLHRMEGGRGVGAEEINLASPSGVRSQRALRARQMIWILFTKQFLSRRKVSTVF